MRTIFVVIKMRKGLPTGLLRNDYKKDEEMKENRKYVLPLFEVSRVAVESSFAVSITNNSTIQEEKRDEDNTNSIEFYI